MPLPHICKRVVAILVLFVVALDLYAQTTVTLEKDRMLKITIPQEYDILPIEEKNDGPYKQWTHCRLWAKNQDHIIFVYTIVIEMSKEGKELNDKVKNVENTDSFIFPKLKSMDLVSQEHSKWYQGGNPWSKKLYRAIDNSWFLVTFVSQTATHMIVVSYDMKNLDDMEEFDNILKSIELKKHFLDNLYVFSSNHEYLAEFLFSMLGIIIFVIVTVIRER